LCYWVVPSFSLFLQNKKAFQTLEVKKVKIWGLGGVGWGLKEREVGGKKLSKMSS
jgi:hypothetical protein